ncbi:hypothetical protein E2C01_009805 [Portunus trituberculatus]|uniref:Uncharacterized protein n=1 Tax=Portunus trituberculatus TaxID=210409 RepID=A0A5B7D6Z4_PORTR|nr:hypothetical protein [Portunus trituberculatus]
MMEDDHNWMFCSPRTTRVLPVSLPLLPPLAVAVQYLLTICSLCSWMHLRNKAAAANPELSSPIGSHRQVNTVTQHRLSKLLGTFRPSLSVQLGGRGEFQQFRTQWDKNHTRKWPLPRLRQDDAVPAHVRNFPVGSSIPDVNP